MLRILYDKESKKYIAKKLFLRCFWIAFKDSNKNDLEFNSINEAYQFLDDRGYLKKNVKTLIFGKRK